MEHKKPIPKKGIIATITEYSDYSITTFSYEVITGCKYPYAPNCLGCEHLYIKPDAEYPAESLAYRKAHGTCSFAIRIIKATEPEPEPE